MQPNDRLGVSRSLQSDLACHPSHNDMLLQVQPNSWPGTSRHGSRQFATLHLVGHLMTGSCRYNATASTYHAGLTVAALNGVYQHGYGHRARLLSLVAVELSPTPPLARLLPFTPDPAWPDCRIVVFEDLEILGAKGVRGEHAMSCGCLVELTSSRCGALSVSPSSRPSAAKKTPVQDLRHIRSPLSYGPPQKPDDVSLDYRPFPLKREISHCICTSVGRSRHSLQAGIGGTRSQRISSGRTGCPSLPIHIYGALAQRPSTTQGH